MSGAGPSDPAAAAALLDGTLRGVATALRAGAIDSAALTEAVLQRARQVDPALNAFLFMDEAGALEAAASADAAMARARRDGMQARLAPLTGVPLAHKDMFARAGRCCTGGSRILGDQVPDATAHALKRLDEAGAIDFGTLGMSEFAYGLTGHNAHFGDCRNPWSLDRIPGGSSSGAAASVAARANFAALGSDTGGSIRVPAACNGLVGIKTTWGAVGRSGAMPLSHSLDTVGVLARDVADCAWLFGLLAGCDAADAATLHWPYDSGWQWAPRERLDGVRIGVADAYGHADCEVSVASAMRESLDALRARGAAIVSVQVPDAAAMQAMAMLVLQAEPAALHRRWLVERPQDYSPQVRARLEPGLAIGAAEYIDALRARGPALAEWHRSVFAHCDALHAPVIGFEVPTLAETDVGGGERMAQLLAGLGRWTRPVNWLGLPALALPAGFAGGMPCGFQLIGPKWSEATLFGIGAAYETERGFTAWRPPSRAARIPPTPAT